MQKLIVTGRGDEWRWYDLAYPRSLVEANEPKLVAQLLARSRQFAADPAGRYLFQAGGKGGGVYVIDRDHMGQYHSGDDSHAVQVIRKTHGIYSAPAFWNQHVFFFWSDDFPRDFRLDNGQLSNAPSAHGLTRFNDPGATPTISANGNTNGIVWILRSKGWRAPDRPAVLYALDAANLGRELYNSEQKPERDRAGLCLRFNIPTVAAGRVYVGAKAELDIYGLLR